MKLFRYRKPSLNTVLGVTRLKKRGKKALGITALLAPFRAPGNLTRRVKRKSGYYAVNRVLRGQVPTPLGLGQGMGSKARTGSFAGLLGCLPLLGVVWVIGSLGSCGKSVEPPAPKQAATAPVQMKNGRILTPEQIRERDAYIARALAKKREREQDELKRAQALAFAAQIEAQEFQRRQAAKNAAALARQQQAQYASPAVVRSPAAEEVAPPQEPQFRVVPGWNAATPPPQDTRPSVSASYVPSRPTPDDPNYYIPPAEYQNLPPGTRGARVVRPNYGERPTYRYRTSGSSYRSRNSWSRVYRSSIGSAEVCGARTSRGGYCQRRGRCPYH